jgi:hypothetical protein
MATVLPQFKLRQLARRGTSDIGRLAKQYKSSIDAITGEYETSFSTYQAGVTEKLKPYEAAVAQYSAALPAYDVQAAAYRQRLEDYNTTLAEIEKNPVTERTERVVTGKTWYGKKKYGDITVYDPKPIPQFTEVAPALPAIPVAPTIEEFDEGEFGTKRAEAETTFKREVGERRAARLGAVSRKMTRPMLRGAE